MLNEWEGEEGQKNARRWRSLACSLRAMATSRASTHACTKSMDTQCDAFCCVPVIEDARGGRHVCVERGADEAGK